MKDSTIEEVVSMIRTGALTARQKQQIIDKIRARAKPDQLHHFNKLMAEEYTIPSGVIYDASHRGALSDKGQATISGRTDKPMVGHTTQHYPDGYRVSQDNPEYVGFHWTNENLDRTHPDYHKGPPDATKQRGDDKRDLDIDKKGNLVK